jgi:Epoxide hydrolase N terminus
VPTEPTTIAVPDDRIADLHDRLERARFAPDHDNDQWEYGVPSSVLRQWAEGWRRFDWRAAEARINAFDQRLAVIDSTHVHVIVHKGVGPSPVPLLLCHGLPWTFWDWHACIEPLADPGAFGGDPADAFDVIIPSLPRFPFSSESSAGPMGYAEIAEVLYRLMTDELGYDSFFSSGGDIGMLASGALGHAHADTVKGIQLFGAVPISVFTRADPLNRGPNFGQSPSAEPTDPVLRTPPRPPKRRSGYYGVSAMEPQTLVAGMYDSPLGLLAWILQHRYNWCDHDGDLMDVYTEDFLLTTVSLLWFSDAFADILRVYHDQTYRPWQPVHDRTPVVESPTGIAFFGGDQLTSQSRSWCAEHYNLVRTSEYERGGHYLPSERPDVAINEIRTTFRSLR